MRAEGDHPLSASTSGAQHTPELAPGVLMHPDSEGLPRRARGFTHLFRSYKRLFSTLGAFAGLIGGCLLLALVLVYPLWSFALAAPEVYSGVALSVLSLAAVFWAVRRLRRIPQKTLFRGVVTVLTLVVGLAAFVLLVVAGRKGIALALIPAALIAHGFMSYGKK